MTETKPSKSARKLELLALQKFGEQLIALNEKQLADLPIDDELRRAISAARRMTSRGALRRQKQLIGKLMRGVDPEQLQEAFASLGPEDLAAKRLFARAENWRDRIIAEGAIAVDALEAQTGQAGDELRSMLRDLAAAAHEKAERPIRRRIFRRVSAMLEAAAGGKCSEFPARSDA